MSAAAPGELSRARVASALASERPPDFPLCPWVLRALASQCQRRADEAKV